MNQFTNELKLKTQKKLMQILNNTNNNNFKTLKQFQKNIIKIDNYFWNLNANLKNIIFI